RLEAEAREQAQAQARRGGGRAGPTPPPGLAPAGRGGPGGGGGGGRPGEPPPPGEGGGGGGRGGGGGPPGGAGPFFWGPGRGACAGLSKAFNRLEHKGLGKGIRCAPGPFPEREVVAPWGTPCGGVGPVRGWQSRR